MIRKPEGYDQAPAYTGESAQLPKGKYVCVIKLAEVQTKRDKEQLALYFDIAEGEYKDFYRNGYEAKKASGKASKDWRDDWRGVYRQNMADKGLPWLKGIITSIEKSNNFTFVWDKEGNEKDLAGKKFGGLFRREQFEANDGSHPFTTRLHQIRSLQGLADAEIPEDYLLPETAQTQTAAPAVDTGFMDIPAGADDGIPFL